MQHASRLPPVRGYSIRKDVTRFLGPIQATRDPAFYAPIPMIAHQFPAVGAAAHDLEGVPLASIKPRMTCCYSLIAIDDDVRHAHHVGAAFLKQALMPFAIKLLFDVSRATHHFVVEVIGSILKPEIGHRLVAMAIHAGPH